MRATALGLCLFASGVALSAQPAGDLARAAEEFKTASQSLGLRGDAPARARGTASPRGAYHGRIYHNFRNDFMDAVPHEITQRGGTKNLLRRNQFGFNVSGPVWIPRLYQGARRTFFSLSYEGVREKVGRSYLRTVAIPEERAGDFSQTVDAAGERLMIYDPTTTRRNPLYNPALAVSASNLEYLRDPLPEGRLAASRLDPVAMKMLDYYPLPNNNAGPFFRNNFFSVHPEVNSANGMIAKVDHSFLDKHRVNTTVSFTNGLLESARLFDTAADPGPTDRVYQNRRVALEHVYTRSPQSINTATVEVSSDVSENTSPGGGIPAALGLNGVGGDFFPWIRFANYLAMGRPSPSLKSARHTWVFTNAHSLKRGRHSLRAVTQLNRYQVNSYLPSYPSGTWAFSDAQTSLPGIVNTGLPFASFLLGLANSAEISQVASPSYFRGTLGILALQDNWEVRPDLTVSFGLNMEIQTPRVEKYDRQSSVDLTLTNPANQRPGALAAAGGNRSRGFQPVRVRPQPNVSLAWNPQGNRKSVVRASYAMSFQAIPIYSNQWGTQGFNGDSIWISPNSQLQPAVVLREGLTGLRVLPDLRPDAVNDMAADYIEPTGRMARYQSSGLSTERELPRGFVASAGLGLAWGRDLLLGNSAVGLNAIHPDNLRFRDGLNDESFRRTLRPYPQYLNLNVGSLYPFGRYRREAAWTRVEKRTARGLSLNAYYEYSRQYDDYSGPYGTQDFFNRHNQWALMPYNNPHRMSVTFMYELPIGVNKPFLSQADWRRHLTTGWAVSGISNVYSGEPLALRAMFNNTGGVLQTVYVNAVPGVDPRVPDQGPELWFNPEAFSHPADFSLGTFGRTSNILRNPSSQNHDLSLSKRFALDAERSVEFNASGFNFLNHANWTDPDTTIGTAATPNANAGKIIGSRGGRVLQLGLRFSF